MNCVNESPVPSMTEKSDISEPRESATLNADSKDQRRPASNSGQGVGSVLGEYSIDTFEVCAGSIKSCLVALLAMGEVKL